MKTAIIILCTCLLTGAVYAQPKHKPVAMPTPKAAPAPAKNAELSPAQRTAGRAPLPPSPPPPPLAPRN